MQWFFQIIFFENVMGISASFLSLKNIFFQNKKKTMLGWMQKRITIYETTD